MEVKAKWNEITQIEEPEINPDFPIEETRILPFFQAHANVAKNPSGLKRRGRPVKDITGQRFGKLTAIELVGRNPYGKALWRCLCDCGGEIVTTMANLQTGATRSCGCLYIKDITGQRFGKLTAMYPTKDRKSHFTVWHCRCDCGNECDVPSMYLYRGDRKTCRNCKPD